MNDLLQQLHELVPAFNVASIPKDATGAYASPVHIIAGLLNVTPVYIQKILNIIGANINGNCTKMKVIADRIEQRNRIMVGNAESILRVLASCNRQEIIAIVARLPAVAPVPQASVPLETHNRPPPSVAPVQQAPVVAQDHQVPVASTPAHVQQIKKPLVLNGMVIEVDPVTSMVNATQMCQAGGKLYAHYSSTAEMTEFVQTLSSNIGIPILDLVKSTPGGNHSGTWVHRRVAMYLAQRISPLFNVQVTGYLDELLLTGRVELGKEKTPAQLDAIWERRIAEKQADDNNAFLREKNCLELSLLRIKCAADEEEKNDRAAKRQRDDVAAEEERVAKRQRDDAAAEDEKVAKRKRDDYDNAKRQRDDAAAVDKFKEENRMQMVRFDAEMAAKAIAMEEERVAKRKREEAAFEEEMRVKKEKGALELAICKLDYNKHLVPFVEDIQNRTNDARVKALCKDIGMALLNQAKFLITGESSATQETRFCDDVTTIGRKLGFDRVFVETHRVSLGKAVAAEFRRRNPDKEPQSTEKHVNSSYIKVFAYDVKDNEWIEDVVRQCLTKNMPAPVVPPSPKAPSRTIINYFTQ